ncbi:MAG: cobalamin biosynthesis protein CbiX [Planctomycetales bacterium]|nr:cobalamin biosynthesis protein CbiX [Planctomycetales bacterium]NIM07622.1 cobalamin biosynthesis protein CbiX [Planctomycetales bacterium]NIN07128.1 cobalamin biosynthesis protein CbiX [Planctomycetales bacterium]NIN76222.1 cobalamin biosynthesis protein CbiX [Planctomycetales bacterium]NIO33444.1 cobalamin biosynthesis protein CbiX [Planctomycetales bacterium]
MDNKPHQIGIIIVDHGSRRAQSNAMLLEVVAMFRRETDYKIVEPAHMELAEPSIETAFDRCVQQGASLVVVHPYFLLPGRHWDQDIPRLAAAAAERQEGVSFLVTAPLGLHPRMADVIQQRIEDCLAHASGEGPACPLCADTDKCQVETR